MAWLTYIIRWWRGATIAIMNVCGLVLLATGDDLCLFAFGIAAYVAATMTGGGMSGNAYPVKDAGEGR